MSNEVWLKKTLAAGRVLASEIRRAGQDAGFSWSGLHRAKSRVGAATDREGFGPGSKCFWRLTDASQLEADSHIDFTPAP